MKTLYSVLEILAASTIIGMVTIGGQEIYAPGGSGSCAAFKKLTDEFEKNVLDAPSVNPPDPGRIQTLVGEYSDEALKLFPST